MTVTAERKQELVTRFGKGEGDTGTPEVQVALLTERINDLTEHLRDVERYRALVQELGLRR